MFLLRLHSSTQLYRPVKYFRKINFRVAPQRSFVLYCFAMKLIELTVVKRHKLAEKTKLNPAYLWQLATGRRTPSAKTALALKKACPSLRLDELLGGKTE